MSKEKQDPLTSPATVQPGDVRSVFAGGGDEDSEGRDVIRSATWREGRRESLIVAALQPPSSSRRSATWREGRRDH